MKHTFRGDVTDGRKSELRKGWLFCLNFRPPQTSVLCLWYLVFLILSLHLTSSHYVRLLPPIIAAPRSPTSPSLVWMFLVCLVRHPDSWLRRAKPTAVTSTGFTWGPKFSATGSNTGGFLSDEWSPLIKMTGHKWLFVSSQLQKLVWLPSAHPNAEVLTCKMRHTTDCDSACLTTYSTNLLQAWTQSS